MSAPIKRNRELDRRLRELAPRIPMVGFKAVRQIAGRGHLRHLPASIVIWQALVTHARHAHTDYDKLLEDGYDRDSARHFTVDAINDVLTGWGCARQVDTKDEWTMKELR